jgi:hypothetical protein
MDRDRMAIASLRRWPSVSRESGPVVSRPMMGFASRAFCLVVALDSLHPPAQTIPTHRPDGIAPASSPACSPWPVTPGPMVMVSITQRCSCTCTARCTPSGLRSLRCSARGSALAGVAAIDLLDHESMALGFLAVVAHERLASSVRACGEGGARDNPDRYAGGLPQICQGLVGGGREFTETGLDALRHRWPRAALLAGQGQPGRRAQPQSAGASNLSLRSC